MIVRWYPERNRVKISILKFFLKTISSLRYPFYIYLLQQTVEQKIRQLNFQNLVTFAPRRIRQNQLGVKSPKFAQRRRKQPLRSTFHFEEEDPTIRTKNTPNERVRERESPFHTATFIPFKIQSVPRLSNNPETKQFQDTRA